MCRTKTTTLLLLALLGFWASGAARFAHEALEHGNPAPSHDEGGGPALMAGGSIAPLVGDGGGDDDDDCPTCRMLVSLQADAGSFTPPPVVLPDRCVGLVVTRDESPIATDRIGLPPARAPPAALS